MKQFDVVENTAPGAREFAPYLAVLSSHFLTLDLVIVAPLLIDVVRAISLVDVPVTFGGAPYVLALSELAGSPPSRLKRIVGTLAQEEDAIRRGLYSLFSGF